MAGGAGTRFWPFSRSDKPKPFLKLFGGESMMEQTLRRVEKVVEPSAVHVVLCEKLEPLLQELPRPVDRRRILVEPAARNTLGAVFIACAQALRSGPEQLVVMLPADHFIPDTDAFCGDFIRALDAADEDSVVTLGIRPTGPETGYGYIETDGGKAGPHALKVKRFVEKPDRARALEYIASGQFYWNAGIYFFKVAHLLAELKAIEPSWAVAVQEMAAALEAGNSQRLAEVFVSLPAISIDYGVMEKVSAMRLIPASFPWSDVGAWDAVASLNGGPETDMKLLMDSSGSRVFSTPDGPFVVLLGVKDQIVVASRDAVLIMDKSRAQDVRKVVDLLREKGLDEFI